MTDALAGLYAVAAGAPDIDLDITLLFQLLLFGVAYFLIKATLIDPYLGASRERLSRTSGQRAKADDAAKRADALLSEYETKIAEARAEATDVRSKLVDEARGKADVRVSEAREWSNSHVETSREALDADLAQAREDVKPRAEELSAAITAKILA